MNNKIDNKILESIKKVILNQGDLEFVLIGGRAINCLLNDMRYSIDHDIALKAKNNSGELSKSKFVKVCKKIKEELESEFKIQINRSSNPNEHRENILDEINCYLHNNFVFKINIFIQEEEHILEISYDSTIPKLNYISNENFDNIISKESAIAIKTVISAKRSQEGTSLLRENYRHIYDLYRLLKEGELDYDEIRKLIEVVHNYELERPNNEKYKYKMEIFEIKNYLKNLLEEKMLNDIIFNIKNTWDIDVKLEVFKSTITKFIEKI